MMAQHQQGPSANVVDRLRFSTLAGALALGTVGLLLAGCARPVGDLGRAQPSFVNDTAMPAAGSLRALAAGQPVSSFNLSDEEQQMRDRIWRFLTSGRAHDWFFDVAAELHRSRITSAPLSGLDPARYFNWLHSTRYQSSTVRYGALADDVAADLATAPATFAAICRVIDVERQRSISAANLPDVGAGARGNIAARTAENHDQIDWFVRALRYRYDSYNYALDHLLVETPSPGAKTVDAALADLGVAVEQAERGQFCTGALSSRVHRPTAPAVPSRYAVGGPGFGAPAPVTLPAVKPAR